MLSTYSNGVYLERFNGSFKREAANLVIFLGESHLSRVVIEYLAHYHQERNHQGRNGQIIEPGEEVGLTEGRICCRKRLGGMLNYHYRDAALSYVQVLRHHAQSSAPVWLLAKASNVR